MTGSDAGLGRAFVFGFDPTDVALVVSGQAWTPTATNTATSTASATPTSTATPTVTDTPTISPTPTITDTPTNSPSASPTASNTAATSPTPTDSATATITVTPTITPTPSPSPSETNTSKASPNATGTAQAACTCAKVGPYADPASRAPATNGDGTSPNRKFQVQVPTTGSPTATPAPADTVLQIPLSVVTVPSDPSQTPTVAFSAT